MSFLRWAIVTVPLILLLGIRLGPLGADRRRESLVSWRSPSPS